MNLKNKGPYRFADTIPHPNKGVVLLKARISQFFKAVSTRL